ncbi:galactose mutarotase [Modestobacter marinus]|uniref:Aldose 1-epimerase n=1 Tax=Modestobacter marinus TaxID=477641 RepID=A0A846LMW4_9ACTN|nr:aldose epimerase family protein [Modestobacter marinus]NIH68936.1 aldose 1-epimerase [Modestobacter marinus]GGL78804.1 aldose 1-epimerase [Modestobacter marinus]
MPGQPAAGATHARGNAAAVAEPFGTAPDGTPVDRWTLSNGPVTVRVLTYGGIVQSVEVPDAGGRVTNVVLGFADLAGYVEHNNPGPYFGALIGRFGNRLAGGRFTVDGRTHQLPLNEGPNTLHGGPEGFDRQVWTTTDVSDGEVAGVRLTLVSPAGHQGFPGTLTTVVTYTLDAASRLTVHYEATTDAPTVVNLTNHTYWNLSGEGSGNVHGHVLQLDAEGYLPIDGTLIPTGEIAPVEGTPFDFRTPTAIGDRLRAGHEQLVRARGYDHTWVLGPTGEEELRRAAVLHDPASGRTLTVATTEPGVQFYSGNFLDGTLVGTGGRVYRQGDGVALETQHFPDSPNQPGFPSTELRPGRTYRSTTVFELPGDVRAG